MRGRARRTALLAAVLSAVLLAGCTDAELKMASDYIRSSTMENYKVSGTVTITPNREGFIRAAELLDEALNSYHYLFGQDEGAAKEEGPSISECLAGHTYRIFYECQARIRGSRGDGIMRLSGQVDDCQPVDLGECGISQEGDLLFSADLMRGIYDFLAEPIRRDGCKSLLFSQEFEGSWKALITDVDYIRIPREEMDPQSWGLLFDVLSSEEASGEFAAMLRRLMESVLSGYSTGLSATSKGDSMISGSLKELIAARDAGFAYMERHMGEQEAAISEMDREFSDLLVRYGFLPKDEAPLSPVDEEPFSLVDENLLPDLLRTALYWRSGIVRSNMLLWGTAFDAEGLVEELTPLIENSRLSYKIGARDGGWDEELRLSLLLLKMEVMTVEFRREIRHDQAELVKPEAASPMDMEEFRSEVYRELRAKNPARKCKIRYESDEKDRISATLHFERTAKVGFWQSDNMYWDGYLRDGRVYLPLRALAWEFGETVGYDGKSRQAYVERSGARIPFSGINVEGVYYVKIREFEKLGYVVDYWNQGSIALSKPES